MLGLNAICEGFGNLVEAYQELEDGGDKRSWETVLEGLKAVCDDLGDAKMGALDANQNGEIEEVCISLIIMSQQMSQIGSVDQDQLALENSLVPYSPTILKNVPSLVLQIFQYLAAY